MCISEVAIRVKYKGLLSLQAHHPMGPSATVLPALPFFMPLLWHLSLTGEFPNNIIFYKDRSGFAGPSSAHFSELYEAVLSPHTYLI